MSDYQLTFKYAPGLFEVLLKYLNPKKEEKILDLGCGQGFYVKEMEEYTKKVIGIDVSKRAIKEAVTQKVKYGDATNLDFEDNIFDKVYSLDTIEHISNLNQYLNEAARVLKPGGIFVLGYPWEPVRGMKVIGTAIRMYQNPLMARKIHLHKLNPEKVKQLIKNTSFSHFESKFIFSLGLYYITVLKKNSC